MSALDRFLGCFFVGGAAYMLALGAGMPTWATPPDAADVGATAGMAAWLLTRRPKP